LLAVAAGAAIAIQASMNAKLGVLLKSAMMGTSIAIVASHFGWFELPVKPITTLKLAGAFSLIAGVLLLNWEPSYVH
jgi:transporter family-2 protein